MKFLQIYRWPILAVLAYVAIAWAWHGQAYWQGLWAYLQDPLWWAENTFSVIVFTVLISWVVGISANHRERMERAPYEGWRIEVTEGSETDTAPLFWNEVRSFHESPLELRRFVQSVISSRGRMLNIRRLDILDGADWIIRDENKRKYVIDMDRFLTGDDCKPS